jgi:hypothetical protein
MTYRGRIGSDFVCKSWAQTWTSSETASESIPQVCQPSSRLVDKSWQRANDPGGSSASPIRIGTRGPQRVIPDDSVPHDVPISHGPVVFS